VADLPDINLDKPAPADRSSSDIDQFTLERLDGQIAWYDRQSTINRRLFKTFKTVIITSAATIPVLTTAGLPHGPQIAAALGVSIAVLEGVQQLNQYQANWANYRTAAEALKHEKYFYLARAGPYLECAKPHITLAERIEALLSQENAKWFMSQTQSTLNDPLRTVR